RVGAFTVCVPVRLSYVAPAAPLLPFPTRRSSDLAMTHILSAVAWPYANGPRHLGHVAGFGVPSDTFSRYMRMAGHDVLMVSGTEDRKSTRLNSSHVSISYAVFCLKKKRETRDAQS